jgi:hypothetical protein
MAGRLGGGISARESQVSIRAPRSTGNRLVSFRWPRLSRKIETDSDPGREVGNSHQVVLCNTYFLPVHVYI